jgi:hypothetical protein
MVMSPVVLGTKNDCAGAAQLQFSSQTFMSGLTSCEMVANRRLEYGSRGVALLDASTKQRLAKTITD